MRSLHIPMAWEEWERMPWRFGWKHEYWDVHAHLTPRHNHVHVRVRIGPRRPRATGPNTRPVDPSDARGLVRAFIEAFEGGVEFCDWPVEKIHEHARQNIADYFAGRRGTPLLEASRLALGPPPDPSSPGGVGQIVGAALLAERDSGSTLDLLMVRPDFRRQGIARALVEAAVEALHERGSTAVLRSAYHVANEESAGWHRAFGFEEEPDLHLARMRRAFYAHELSRREEMETAEAGRERDRLESLCELWSRRVEELEEVADREGFEAVTPVLRYHR